MVLALSVVACVVPTQSGYSNAGYSNAGYGYYGGAAAPPAQMPRQLSFNGRVATQTDLQIIAQLEAQSGTRLPDGAYWYDNYSGLAGAWGGPATIAVAAGLGLGGPLPPEASGGGTGVFVNGRELHPIDVQRLGAYARPGRYWLDARGNVGYENGPAIANILVLMQQSNGGARGPDGACGGHMGPYATIRRGDEVAAFCRSQGHWAGQTYHNGDGYYIDVR